jgi:alpha-galactosidase
MKRSTKKTAAAPARRKKNAPPAAAAETPAAVHYVPAEMFDVSKVVRGAGECEVACAAIEKRFSTSAKKHFFGLRTSVPFAVEIPVDGDAAAFEAACGVDAAGAKGKVSLKVLADGREVWSGVVATGDKADLKARADLRGAKTFTLVAEPAEGTGGGVGAVWGGAKLLFADGKVLPNDVRRTSRQLGVLTPPERPEPRVNGPRVYGVRPGRPILYRVPATGAGRLRVEVVGLGLDCPKLANLSYDPKTRILSGRIDEPGEYVLAIRATNHLGSDEKPFTIKVGETLCLTPAMGWSSWNAFGGSVSDEKVRAAADALVSTGLADHGWAYVNVDDFWQNIPERKAEDPALDGPLRDAGGRLAPNSRFPDMKALVDHIHAKGLKAGIYSSPGPFTCGRAAGSWEHEELDAKTFVDWGFDYLKHDWCFYDDVAFGSDVLRAMYPYLVMGAALRHQKRDVVLSLCQYGMANVSAWGRCVGAQSWRTTGDVFDTWSSVSAAIEKQKRLYLYAGPGAWNDPDMLCVGAVCWNDGKESRLAPNEQYTHVSLWALLAAPLMIGCDLTKLSPFTRSLLSNDEVIEIDQDELGKAAGCIAEGDDWEVWARPLADGSIAAGLYNKSNREQTIAFDLQKAGLLCKWLVRDVWRQEDVGVFAGSYEASVPGHATHLVRLRPCRCGKLRDDVSDIRDAAWRLLREKDLAKKGAV